ncbi:MAG: AAA family ATPase [Candidatus Delongbacteria bacterium]|nr:AAA family ATPase [Candidatus Delongbacteria bacterium]
MINDIENKEFQNAFDLIKDTNLSFFLTGKAGTGKSTFLKYIVENVSKNFIVVAPSGIAAINAKGVTIHSFFQFPLRPLLPKDDGIKIFGKSSKKREIISNMDTLIIDEVSMTRADLIDGIDYSLRKNGGMPNLPFGGKQVVFIGDIFQLKPVTNNKSGEDEILDEIYQSTYFYGAKIFNELNLNTIELQKVYRQSDDSFISLLDKVRTKELSQEDIDLLNKRVCLPEKNGENNLSITLTTINKNAIKENDKRLALLKTDSFKYSAEITGEYEKSKYPTDDELVLKVGAQVIFIKNDAERRWINGTLGEVVKLSDTEIKVKLEDGRINVVEPQIWDNIKYSYNKEKKKIEQEIVGTFKQYPLKLAWAITIHKSQGLTFDKVIIDLNGGTFASGQTYVALSRAKTFEGIFLKQKLKLNDIKIDDEIMLYHKSYNANQNIDDSIEKGKRELNLLRSRRLSELGNIYFSKALDNLEDGDFKDSYKNFQYGFEYTTCECTLFNSIPYRKDKIVISFNKSKLNCKIYELDFVRSVFYLFTKQFEKALQNIESFIEFREDLEIGHYIKSRILMGLNRIDEGIAEMKLALSMQKTARGLYRLGRYKEELFKEFGLNYLIDSLAINPSCVCCHRTLKNQSEARNIKIETNTNNILINSFNHASRKEYDLLIDTLCRNPIMYFTILSQFKDEAKKLTDDGRKISEKIRELLDRHPLAVDVVPEFLSDLEESIMKLK